MKLLILKVIFKAGFLNAFEENNYNGMVCLKIQKMMEWSVFLNLI